MIYYLFGNVRRKDKKTLSALPTIALTRYGRVDKSEQAVNSECALLFHVQKGAQE
jgi:hypothetical protein